MRKKGTIEAIVGCMSCGKSEELIRRLLRVRIARQQVVVFKPEIDTRTDAVTVASRSGTTFPAVAVSGSRQMLELLTAGGFRGVVGIDEVQFFDDGIVEAVEELVKRGLRIIVSGLDTDYRGRPFGPVPGLLAVADSVTKLTAVCMRCQKTATRTQLLAPLSPDSVSPVFIGGDESYEARCRDCHTVPK